MARACLAVTDPGQQCILGAVVGVTVYVYTLLDRFWAEHHVAAGAAGDHGADPTWR
jgi:hypothetical protein